MENWKERTLDSGVTVLFGPFPHGLYHDIMARALDEHPNPIPPQKEIEVVDGTEQVDDLEDEQYKADMEKARRARANLVGEAALDLCIQVKGGLEQYEPTLERLAGKYVKDPLPDEPEERRIWFLSKYALRTTKDWRIIGDIQRFSQIDDEEVSRMADSFPG